MIVHVYAPSPERVFQVTDFNCPIPDRQGRRCGSYHLLVEVFSYFSTGTCCSCGGRFGDGEWTRGSLDDARRAREKWEAAEVCR